MKLPGRSQRGVSIIEVLVSFTVLTVAVLALLGLLPVAARQQSSSDYQNRALYLAQEYMDQILADPAAINNPVPPQGPQNPYLISRTLAADANNPGCSLVTVDLSWLEQSRVRHVTLRSLVYQ